jgi:hypothetical protein
MGALAMVFDLFGLQLHQVTWSSIMKQRYRFAILGGLVILCLAGCGAIGGSDSVKFDATDAKSSYESLRKMTTGMSDGEQKAFRESASAVTFHMNQGTQNTSSGETYWKDIHGMTKAEIETKAREIEAQQGALTPKQ